MRYLILVTLLCVVGSSSADTVLFSFDQESPCSCNPRASWFAFGAGTSDSGITASGYSGNALYHAVDWNSSSWGIGDIASAADLTAYSGIRLTAKLTPGSGYSGAATIRLALDLPAGEWTTTSVTLGTSWHDYTFPFDTLSGPGTLDLSSGELKIIIEKNGQSGDATILVDEITGIGGAVDELTPVLLNPPPDGDSIRAMWFYSEGYFQNLAALQEVLDFSAREGVNRIYLGGYLVWATGTSEEKANMREFIAVAHDSGIKVEAVLDGFDWHQRPALVRTRINQILSFQDVTATTNDDFDAIHFDMEFWLDDSWQTGSAGRYVVAEQYLDNLLVNARDHLDDCGKHSTEIAVDLSAHFDTPTSLPNPFTWNGVTQTFVEHVLDLTDTAVFMSYYDTASALINVSSVELDEAAAKGTTIVLGADIQPSPPEVSSNTFGDNYPDPYADMTQTLEFFHERLSASRLEALAGFSVFYYNGWKQHAPNPGHRADLDGDNDVDLDDFVAFEEAIAGPAEMATGLMRDADLDRDGDVDLADYSMFMSCYTGSGISGPVITGCEK